jgi:4-alpha-glucanotransferase
MKKITRKSGILLHPTSLPGEFGIGELGPEAFRFVDFLAESRQSLWQVMPLGPTGYGDSPYQNLSAFAGSPLLISLESLVKEGLLSPQDFATKPIFPDGSIEFGEVIPWKIALLRKSFARFQQSSHRHLLGDFGAKNHSWLNDYALFAAIKEAHAGEPWNKWEPALVVREPSALAKAYKELREQVQFYLYLQFLFEWQWSSLRTYANEKKVSIVGDIPIFVAYDSADVWSNPGLFSLDENYLPSVVAGVPPDYFSKTGQRWGNPLYRWDAMAKTGYAWWIERFRVLLRRVDEVRLDHFRGFAGFWEIPAEEETAINGRWVSGPGRALFDSVFSALGRFSIIAEDLGVITPDVEALRDGLQLPGMKILQFGFGGTGEAPYLPHHHPTNSVVYTGTHDNDTTLGWWQTASATEKQNLADYVGHEIKDPSWELIRLGEASVADIVLLPLQDVLGLGTSARMNTPSQASGNWGWRYTKDALTPELAYQLGAMTHRYGRTMTPPALPPKKENKVETKNPAK